MSLETSINPDSTYNKKLRRILCTSLILLLAPLNTMANTSNNPALDNTQNMNKSCHTVILGASYAKSWKINTLIGCQVINKGVDGNQSHEMLDRIQNDVITLQPEYVLLWGFINDIFRSNPDKIDQTIERVKTSYTEMIETSLANNIEPVIATEVTIREPLGLKSDIMNLVGKILGKTSYQSKINKHVININLWLREVAAKNNLRLLDLEKTLADSDGKRKKEYSKDDGSHISKEAYSAITLASSSLK